MTEVGEAITIEVPEILPSAPEAQYLLDTDKSFENLDDEDFDRMIDEAEIAFGRRFEGDRKLAKFYLDEFVSGVVSVFEQQGKRKDLRGLKIGMIDSEMMARGGPTMDEKTGKLVSAVAIDFRVLEHMTFFGAEESYSDFRYEEENLGPTWFVARQLGIEEAAHACMIKKKQSWEVVQDPNSIDEYHQTDVEQDGLKWRIFDAERIMEDPYLSVKERVDISYRLRELKRTMQTAHKIRVNRTKRYARYEIHNKPVRKNETLK